MCPWRCKIRILALFCVLYCFILRFSCLVVIFIDYFVTWWYRKNQTPKKFCVKSYRGQVISELKATCNKKAQPAFRSLLLGLSCGSVECQQAKSPLLYYRFLCLCGAQPPVKAGGVGACPHVFSFGSFLFHSFPMCVCMTHTLPLWGGFPKGQCVLCMGFDFFLVLFLCQHDVGWFCLSPPSVAVLQRWQASKCGVFAIGQLCKAVAGFPCSLWATMLYKLFGRLAGLFCGSSSASLNAHADGWQCKSEFGLSHI